MVVGNPDVHFALLRDEEATHLAHVGIDTPDDVPIPHTCVSFEHSFEHLCREYMAQAEGQARVRTIG